MVPPLQEAAEVLAAALLTVALAERLPQRVAVAGKRQVAEGHDTADARADGVAQVQIENPVETVVLVERTNASQIGASEDHEIILQSVYLDRFAGPPGLRLVEVSQ